MRVTEKRSTAISRIVIAFTVCALIGISIFLVYSQTMHFHFINFDDPIYVRDNPHVKKGLTLETIRWAFTDSTFISNYWAPVTWISIISDFTFHGMNAGGYHLTNLMLHTANSILLFFVFLQLTRAMWKSAFIAALFALHPLHVESVAWVTERKDVLSTFFWLLTMLSYNQYARSRNTTYYILVLLSFILGLMAKPMLITLPFVLLLIDYWPLNRVTFEFQNTAFSETTQEQTRRIGSIFHNGLGFINRNRWLLIEKIPFFILVVMVSIATFLTQKIGGAIQPLDHYSVFVRLQNAFINYLVYIYKTFWPFDLSVIYPHPGALPLWDTLISVLLFVAVSAWSIKNYRSMPWLIVGWLWYVGTLVPVIGLIVIGPHSMADRYTYVPHIGLFLILAWAIPALTDKMDFGRKYGLIAIPALFILSILSWIQTNYWVDSVVLFKHAIAVTKHNSLAHNNLGTALEEKGEIDQAIVQFREALRIQSHDTTTHINLANALNETGRSQEALLHCRIALGNEPDNPEAHVVMGNIWMKENEFDRAVRHYETALRRQPESSIIHNNLGGSLLRTHRIAEAIDHFQHATRLDPMNGNARHNLASALKLRQELDAAISAIKKDLVKTPDNERLYLQLGTLYQQNGLYDPAMEAYRKTLTIKPDYLPALTALGVTLVKKNKPEEAISVFKHILSIQPDRKEAYYNIACLYAKTGKTDTALAWLKLAVDAGYDNWDLMKKDPDLDSIQNLPAFLKLLQVRQ